MVSEENLQKPETADVDNKELSIPIGDETYEVTLNKSKEELTIKDPATGRVVTIRARVEEPEEDTTEADTKPLSPEEFRNALQKMDALGLTWTADSIPRVIAKDESDDAFLSEEFMQLQEAYPDLPRELSGVVFYALTGMPSHESIVGGKEDLEKKVSTVREFLLTSEYRADFFFKHALKIPYFEAIDWEVLFKTHERNVAGMPGVAYALLMLSFHNPNPRIGKLDQHQNVTVAANLKLVDKLIGILIDVRTALEDARKLTDKLNEEAGSEDDAELS
jgi:hypothetical protein